MSDKAKIISKLKRFKTNPNAFVTEVLGVTPDKWQMEALESIVKHDRISVRSGHGVGKSAYLSWVILWWMSTRLGKVACTAPTGHQLQDVLWGELSKWYRKMPKWYQDQLSLKNERLEVVGSEAEAFAVARTARRETPEAFQGFHSSAGMLFIVDEASGVDNLIFEVGQGAMSSQGAKTILTGNPTRTSGYFYDTFHSDRANWHTIKVGCAEAKNVDPAFIQEMAEKYGADSNVYRVRVEGEFSKEGDDTVIPLSWIESSVARDVEYNPNRNTVWGLDVARFGSDRTALCKRRGNTITEPIVTWQGKDLMQTCGLVMAEYKKVEAFADERPEEILVDSIGLGSGVVDRLAELGLPARGINVGEAPSIDGKTYMRLRDELWFRAREWFEQRDCCLPEDSAELVAELSIPSYHYTSAGKIQVESKDNMKKRGLRSPDCFVGETLITTPSGKKRIDELVEGDVVITPLGTAKIIKTWIDEVATDSLTTFKSLTGKGKHRVFTWNAGWVRLDNMTSNHILETDSLLRLCLWQLWKLLCTRGKGLEFKRQVDTIKLAERLTRRDFFIDECGQITTARFQIHAMFTTLTVIGEIMKSKILSWLKLRSTNVNICKSDSLARNTQRKTINSLMRSDHLQRLGISLKKAVRGTLHMVLTLGKSVSPLSVNVLCAETSMNPIGSTEPSIAREVVDRRLDTRGIKLQSETATIVDESFSLINIVNQNAVDRSVPTGSGQRTTRVYNLTLDRDNVYYANGVLVENCADAFCLTLANETAFRTGSHSWSSELPEMEVAVV